MKRPGKKISMTLVAAVAVLCAVSLHHRRHRDPVTADAYRFETVDRYARQHAAIIAATDTSTMAYQSLLMDVSSRAHALRAQGDSLLADFFLLSVQTHLANLQSTPE